MIYARFIDQAEDETFFILGYHDDEPMGAGLLVISGCTAEIGPVTVLEAARGKGLGGLMVRMLIRKAYNLGCTSQLARATAESAAFFSRLGFTVLSDQEKNAGFIMMIHEGDVSGHCG